MVSSQKFLSICRQCKAFCCIEIKLPITEKEKQDILDAGFKNCFEKVDNEIYEIKLEKNGRCPYLKNDFSCEINSVKPKLCKLWPIIPRYKNNEKKCILVKCPLFTHISRKEIKQKKDEALLIHPLIISHLWDITPEIKNRFKRFEYKEI